jgi:hypothetical protein
MKTLKESKEQGSCDLELDSKKEYDILTDACSIERNTYENEHSKTKRATDRLKMEKYNMLLDKLKRDNWSSTPNITKGDATSLLTAVNDLYYIGRRSRDEETKNKIKELIYSFDKLIERLDKNP